MWCMCRNTILGPFTESRSHSIRIGTGIREPSTGLGSRSAWGLASALSAALAGDGTTGVPTGTAVSSYTTITLTSPTIRLTPIATGPLAITIISIAGLEVWIIAASIIPALVAPENLRAAQRSVLAAHHSALIPVPSAASIVAARRAPIRRTEGLAVAAAFTAAVAVSTVVVVAEVTAEGAPQGVNGEDA